jgi:hypothetical protein
MTKVKQLNDMLEQNPDLENKVMEVFNTYQQQPQQPQQPAVDPKFMNELSMTKKELNSIKEEMAFNQLKSDMNDIKNRHADLFNGNENLEQELAKFAVENKIYNLDLALKAMNYDNIATQKLNEGQQIASTAANRKNQVAGVGGSKGKTGKGDYKTRDKDGNPKSYDQMQAEIMANPEFANLVTE